MAGNPRVLELLEEILDSGKAPEEVCRDCPELLPEVRQRWQAFRRIDQQVVDLLPGLRTVQGAGAIVPGLAPAGLPQVPGYEVEAVLGRGGMGVVYKARHLALKRTVALKMLAGTHSDPAERARFRAEAEAVARLQHPNIVQIYEIGEAGGLPFIALEYVAGGSLAERLAGRPLPPRDAARLVAALAEGMHVAHSRNLVHRDLKPGNVLLADETGTPIGQCQPKVTDFGLVRQLDADSGQTFDGVVMGTPSYMAPEQAEGRARSAGPPADVYALGAILYECLTGRPPFQGATPLETLLQVRSHEPAAPSALNRRVPRDLETICLKCLRKPPERRYSSARELADDLGRFVRGEPVAARPVGVAERVRKWVWRRPASAGLLAAAVLLAWAGVVGVWLLSQQRAIARGRQARTDEQVLAVIQQAQAKLDAGWKTHDLATLTEAKIEADQAEGVAHNGGASPEVRHQAGAFQADAVARLERARRNRELMDALLDIAGTERVANHPDAAGVLGMTKYVDNVQYAAAFRRWGLDVDGTTEAEVVARLGAEPNVVTQEVIAALDRWTLARRRMGDPAAGWQRLSRIAGRLDRSDRGRLLRGLVVGETPPRPEGLAAAVGAASPWLALWELTRGGSARQLLAARREIDPSAEPAATVVLLADACVSAGDLDGAERVLRQALTARADQVVLFTTLARLQLERRGPPRFGEAIGYYRAARALRPGLSNMLCFALFHTKRYEEAEDFLRGLIRREPDNLDFRGLLCQALLYREKYPELKEASLELIDLKPKSALAHATYGAALAHQKRPGEAEEAYRKSLALDPDNAVVHNLLGLVLMDQGRDDAAASAFRQALSLKPDLQVAYVNLGNVRTRQRRFGEAVELYRKAVQLQPDALAYVALGTFLGYNLQDYEGAEAALRRAVALQPNYILANTNLGHVLLWRGKHAEAADAFRQLVRQHPKDVFLTKILCRALTAAGRGEEAQAAWRPMLDAHLDDHEAWYGYPELCLLLGQNDEYRRVRTGYLKRFAASKDPVIATRTARACLLTPCTEDELRTASALTEVGSASRRLEHEWLRPHLVFTQGLLEYRRGRLERAIALMDADAPGKLVLAMARSRQGRAADAQRAFTEAVLCFDWSAARADEPNFWLVHVLRREAEAMILPTLPDFLEGSYQPQQEDERVALLAARLAHYQVKGFRGAASRLFSDLFRTPPKLPEIIAEESRFYAARAAALAGCGKGIDADQLDDKERALRRRQALEWLRQNLTRWSETVDNRDPQRRALIRSRLRNWQTDYDLAGVRDRGGLGRLPHQEREQWERLWADVAALLRDADLTGQGQKHAARRQWGPAADCYARALKLGPTDDGHFWFEYAALLLLSGDRPGYARACARMMEACSKAGGPRAYHVARACTLAPDAVPDPSQPGRLAEKELRASAHAFWSLTEQGALHYRAGRFPQAVALFEQSLLADAKAGRAVLNWLWLALAQHRLGKPEEARRWLDKATLWLDQYRDGMPDRAEVELGLHLHNWLEAHVLRREAEALIRPAAKR